MRGQVPRRNGAVPDVRRHRHLQVLRREGHHLREDGVRGFLVVLDKKGACRDFMEPPKQCDKCGGWGSVPIFRGINTSVSPAGCMQEGPRGKYSEKRERLGKCSTCKGTGYVKRPPDWLKEQIIATSPPRFQIAGPLMTTKQQIGPLIVPQDAERWEAKNMIKNWGSLS